VRRGDDTARRSPALAGQRRTDFPAARVESAEQRLRAAERFRTWLSQRWDAADLVSIEDEHGILSLEGGSWSFQTWDEIP
jgi:hypothetical protein